MANEKEILSRITHKHDIEANWEKATNFIPKAGELIIYDKDNNYPYERLKIGDGIKKVNELDFFTFATVETWTDENTSQVQLLPNLTINMVKDQETYDKMEASGLIDENGLYLVKDDTQYKLPKVSSEDAGKFLRVSDAGFWVAEMIEDIEGARF